MNLSPHVLRLLLLLAALVWIAPLRAQPQPAPASTPATTPPPQPVPVDPDNPPAGSTVINSDELQSDQNTHISIFTGNVIVTGTNFVMTCEEMTVYFTPDNKIDNIIATGNVIINQPGRVTHAGRAHYFSSDDRFVLTDQPVIVDNKNQLSAPEITIWRTNQTLKTKGRSKTILINTGSSTNSTTNPAAPLPAGP